MLFLILGYFFPFYPPNSRKNYNFKKTKKTPGEVIVLHTCNKNHEKMMYGSWGMVCDWCNCFPPSAILCLLILLTAKKIKIIIKSKRKAWKYLHFRYVYQKLWSDDGQFLKLASDRYNCYFSFWAIFSRFTSLIAQKIIILGKPRKPLEKSSFYIRVTKIMTRWCTVPKIWYLRDTIAISRFGLLFSRVISP